VKADKYCKKCVENCIIEKGETKMFWFKKKLVVPQSNETVEKDVVQLWRVDWESRYGSFSNNTKKETEVFTSEEDAKAFKLSLENAFKLIKHTSGNQVSIEKYK
jgi:hypothetical protein